MAVVKKILVIKFMPSDDGKTVTPVPAFQEPDNQHKLHVKGAVDFELYNLGTASVILWDGVVIVGGGSYTPPKSNSMLFADDIDIKWEDDFSNSHSAGDIVVPATDATPR